MIRDWMGIFSSSDTVNPTQLWNESSGILWLSAPGTTHQETTLKFHLSSWDDGVKPASLDLKKSNPNQERGEDTLNNGPWRHDWANQHPCRRKRCMLADAGRRRREGGRFEKFSFHQMGGLMDTPAPPRCLCCSELWVIWTPAPQRVGSQKPMSTVSMRLARQSHYWTARYFISQQETGCVYLYN